MFEYIVQPGDYLYRIADYFNVSVQAILLANPGLDPNFLYVGQRIRIPISRYLYQLYPWYYIYPYMFIRYPRRYWDDRRRWPPRWRDRDGRQPRYDGGRRDGRGRWDGRGRSGRRQGGGAWPVMAGLDDWDEMDGLDDWNEPDRWQEISHSNGEFMDGQVTIQETTGLPQPDTNVQNAANSEAFSDPISYGMNHPGLKNSPY